MTKETEHFHISSRTMVNFLGILLLIAVAYLIRDILMALVFAVIIASAAEPAIEWLKTRKIPRILSVIIIYLALGIAFSFAVYLIVPLLLEEIRNLSISFPELQEKFLSGLNQSGFSDVPFFGDGAVDALRLPRDYLEKVGGGVFNFASAIFGGIFSFVLVVVFSFYIAAQEKGIENFLRLLTPVSHEAYVVDLWERSQRKLGRWLRAQLVLGAIVGVLIFLGLTFLGVRHAFIFALIAGVFEIIPVVGPILSAVPAVITALGVTPFLGMSVVILYVAVQQLESHVVVPVVMQRTTGLSPLVVVLALLIGAQIGGIFGILLAVPFTTILSELLNDWDKKKRALME